MHYLLAQNFPPQQAFSCLANQKPDNTHVCKNLNSICCSNPFSKQQMSNPNTRRPESQHRQRKIFKLISFVNGRMHKMPTKNSATARKLFKNRLVKFMFARFVDDDKTLVTAFTHNAAPTRFLARIGFPIRAITVLQTVKADSLQKFLTSVILSNKTLAYNIVHAWMAEQNYYIISAEQWSRLNKDC